MFLIISNPEQCPRFDRCNANLCPLDEHLHMRKYFQEELCFYLREFVKIESGKTQPGFSELETKILKLVKQNIGLMSEIGGAKYRYKINRAKKYKSKRDAQHIKREEMILDGPTPGIEGSHQEEIIIA